MKKTIAMMLIVAFLFSFAFSGFAEDEQTEFITEPTTLSENVFEEVTEPPAEEETVTENGDENPDGDITEEEKLVRMWICSSYLGYFPTGHSWLYFENLSTQSVFIGIYELLPGQGVSVGTFCNQLKGFGVYYNIETHKGTPFDVHTLSTDLTADELNTVSEAIYNHNYWGLVHNCLFFSTLVFNKVSETKAIYTFLPLLSMLDLRIKGGEAGTLEMMKTTKDEVFRLKKVDGEYTLICCNDYLLFD